MRRRTAVGDDRCGGAVLRDVCAAVRSGAVSHRRRDRVGDEQQRGRLALGYRQRLDCRTAPSRHGLDEPRMVEVVPQLVDPGRVGEAVDRPEEVLAILPAARVRGVGARHEGSRAADAVGLHLAEGVGEVGVPVAVAPVDGETAEAVGVEVRADSREQSAALIVDRAPPAEVVVVLPDCLQPLARDAATSRDVLEERHDVARLLGSTERHEEQCVVRVGGMSRRHGFDLAIRRETPSDRITKVMRVFGPYGDVLTQARGLRASPEPGLLARLPISTIPLGIVLLVEYQTGSYGQAGVVSACYMVASGDLLSGPRPAHRPARAATGALRRLLLLRDRHHRTGDRRSQADCAGAASRTRSPSWPDCSFPPIGAAVRARWTYVMKGGPLLHTAFSLEAVVDEIIFMAGPILITVLAVQVNELSGLLTVMAIATVGGLWLATMRRTEPPARAAGPTRDKEPIGWFLHRDHGRRRGLPRLAVRCERGRHGRVRRGPRDQGLTGVLLAIWAMGSLIAGVITGAVKWKSSALTRYRYGTLCLAVVMTPLPFIDSLWMLGGVPVRGRLRDQPDHGRHHHLSRGVGAGVPADRGHHLVLHRHRAWGSLPVPRSPAI